MCAQNYKDDDYTSSSGGGGGKRSTGKFKYALRNANSSYKAAVSSGKSEAMVKNANWLQGGAVLQTLKYITRTRAEDLEAAERAREQGEVYDKELLYVYTSEGEVIEKDKKKVVEIYREWSQTFEKPKAGSKYKKRDAVHLILSADAPLNDRNLEKVRRAASNALEEYRLQGYDYVLAMHGDGNKPHAHVVLRTAHRDKALQVAGELDKSDVKKFRFDKPEILKIRSEFAKGLSDLGLQHVATLRQDRPKLLEQMVAFEAPLERQYNIFIGQMEKASPSYNVFLRRREWASKIRAQRESIYKADAPIRHKRKALKSLRGLERKLLQPTSDFERSVKATINEISRDAESLIHSSELAKNSPRHKDRSERKKIVSKLNKQIELSHRLAMSEIKRSKLSIGEKQELVAKLTIAYQEKNKSLKWKYYDQKKVSQSQKFLLETLERKISYFETYCIDLHRNKSIGNLEEHKDSVEKLEERISVNEQSKEKTEVFKEYLGGNISKSEEILVNEKIAFLEKEHLQIEKEIGPVQSELHKEELKRESFINRVSEQRFEIKQDLIKAHTHLAENEMPENLRDEIAILLDSYHERMEAAVSFDNKPIVQHLDRLSKQIEEIEAWGNIPSSGWEEHKEQRNELSRIQWEALPEQSEKVLNGLKESVLENGEKSFYRKHIFEQRNDATQVYYEKLTTSYEADLDYMNRAIRRSFGSSGQDFEMKALAEAGRIRWGIEKGLASIKEKEFKSWPEDKTAALHLQAETIIERVRSRSEAVTNTRVEKARAAVELLEGYAFNSQQHLLSENKIERQTARNKLSQLQREAKKRLYEANITAKILKAEGLSQERMKALQNRYVSSQRIVLQIDEKWMEQAKRKLKGIYYDPSRTIADHKETRVEFDTRYYEYLAASRRVEFAIKRANPQFPNRDGLTEKKQRTVESRKQKIEKQVSSLVMERKEVAIGFITERIQSFKKDTQDIQFSQINFKNAYERNGYFREQARSLVEKGERGNENHIELVSKQLADKDFQNRLKRDRDIRSLGTGLKTCRKMIERAEITGEKAEELRSQINKQVLDPRFEKVFQEQVDGLEKSVFAVEKMAEHNSKKALSRGNKVAAYIPATERGIESFYEKALSENKLSGKLGELKQDNKKTLNMLSQRVTEEISIETKVDQIEIDVRRLTERQEKFTKDKENRTITPTKLVEIPREISNESKKVEQNIEKVQSDISKTFKGREQQAAPFIKRVAVAQQTLEKQQQRQIGRTLRR